MPQQTNFVSKSDSSLNALAKERKFMKRETKIFFRTVKLTSVVLICVLIGFFGITEAYENIRKIGFGEYRKAIEIENGTLKFFDFEIDLL